MAKTPKKIPDDPRVWAADLAEALRIRRPWPTPDSPGEKGRPGYMLVKGRLSGQIGGHCRLYEFLSTDGLMIPQDIQGEIVTGSGRFKALVRGQRAALVRMEVASVLPLPENIAEAELFLDQDRWLTGVADALKNAPGLNRDSASWGAKAFRDFILCEETPGEAGDAAVLGESASIQMIMEPDAVRYGTKLGQVCRSQMTAGKSLLVCASQNEKLDSILEAMIGSGLEENGAGESVAPGQGVVRLGLTCSNRIPKNLLWNHRLSSLDAEKQRLARERRETLQSLDDEETRCREQLRQWARLEELRREFGQIREIVSQKQGDWQRNLALVDEREAVWRNKQAAARKAARAWVGREAKRIKAVLELREAEAQLKLAEEEVGRDRVEKEQLEERAWQAAKRLDEQELRCQGILEPEALTDRLAEVARQKAAMEQALEDNHRSLDLELKPLLAQIGVVFGTFPQLMENGPFRERQYDCVLVADACQSLVPLTFWAASMADRQVILGDDGLDLGAAAQVSQWGQRPAGRPALVRMMETKLKAAGAALLRSDRPLTIPDHLVGLGTDVLISVATQTMEPGADMQTGLVLIDTARVHNWSGKEPGSLSDFNAGSALASIQFAAQLIASQGGREAKTEAGPKVMIVTAHQAQARLVSAMLADSGLMEEVGCSPLEAAGRVQADWVVLDTVLDVPHVSDPRCSRRLAPDHRHELSRVLASAGWGLAVVGSSDWMAARAHPQSVWGELWAIFAKQARIIFADDLVLPGQDLADDSALAHDLSAAIRSIWGVVPALDKTLWQSWGRSLGTALGRGVKLTLITGSIAESDDPLFADQAVRKLRQSGAVVSPASGWAGYEFIIDDEVFYGQRSRNTTQGTGFQRLKSRRGMKCYRDLMQADLIRKKLVTPEGSPRVCPLCGWPVQLVNQIRPRGFWDDQPLKVGCLNENCRQYLRNLEERWPFQEAPRCRIDNRIRYERVRRGRGQVWQCPAHPENCPREKCIPGDPGQPPVGWPISAGRPRSRQASSVVDAARPRTFIT